jgi:hypothetical protein
MAWLRVAVESIVSFLAGLVRALVFDLWLALRRLWRGLLRCLWLLRQPKGPVHKINRASCVPIHHPAFKKPDPLIYDQYYLMSLGLAVSWQNPDIAIFQGAAPVASAYDLLPSTHYTIRARIWNGSPDAVVAHMPVTFSYLSFGISTVSHPIGQTTVDLGVKGSAFSPAFAEVDWLTPATPGHYCVQVAFAWADDSNPANNLGQHNTQVVEAHSPAHASFTLRNDADERRRYAFEVDTFELQPPPRCPDDRRPPRPQTWKDQHRLPQATLDRNSRAENALPPDWSVSFDPAEPTLVPGEELQVTARIDPPDSFHGRMHLNVHAFAGVALAGGVTIVVERN